MNLQQRVSFNGFGIHRNDRDNSNRPTIVGKESPSREKLVYLTTCLIGHHVEVHVQDGTVYTGIFHATQAEKDFGIILKMANLVGSRGQRHSDTLTVLPYKTLIIPANELGQIIAKDVPVTREALTNELLHEKHQELMIDSFISQSRHVDVERELERWVPDDDDDYGCPELENIFDGSWNRGWDQFEVNETLFGVKSTFNEELYTTKLEKGPQMRDLERVALKMAREIEGEDTNDLHLAEERGIELEENLELDEEAKYSSVIRKVDDSGYEEIEDILFNTHNNETFGYNSGTHLIEEEKVNTSKPVVSLSANATEYSPHVSSLSKSREKTNASSSGSSDYPLSPTSSISSEKSPLNPNAKEFKPNPNAKSFITSHSPLRPASPVTDGSLYYPGIVHMPAGVGMGPSYTPHQPVMFNPHAAQTQHTYFPPNDPQMMVGHPQQFMYMPNYPNENPYKGRNF